MNSANSLLQHTPFGLYCAQGDFFIDPVRAVERAVITHGHSDHARPGHRSMLCHPFTAAAIKHRQPQARAIETVGYNDPVERNGVRITLHPAGHIPGSAQIRLERGGEVWVVSGDYKLSVDALAQQFEPVRCDVFITESTFAMPIYRFPDQASVQRQINDWWAANRREGRLSVLLGYSLGKAQHLLSLLDPEVGPIFCSTEIASMTEALVAAGVSLTTPFATFADNKVLPRDAMVLLSPSDAQSIGGDADASFGYASGWMLTNAGCRQRGLDAAFVLSDHADWPQLLNAIELSGAERVFVTHGFTACLVRYLKEQGREAAEL